MLKKEFRSRWVLLLILAILIPFSSALHAGSSSRMVLLIVPGNGFDQKAYTNFQSIFKQIRIKTVTASASLNILTGDSGGSFRPDIGFEMVDPEQFDAVVLIGNQVAQQYWNNEEVLAICKAMIALKRPIAAQGFAVLTIGKADLLKDIRVAGTPEIRKYLEKSGAIYTTKPVLKDQLILTASAKADSRQLAILLRKALRPHAYPTK